MYGLVLEGGGTKGSYHLGAYKALLDRNIEIGGITGTSIGAINGAMLLQGDYNKALELWKDLRPSMLVDIDREILEKYEKSKLEFRDLGTIGGQIGDIIRQKGLDISPFKKLLKEYIDEDKIRESSMDFGIVTVDLTNLSSVELFIEDIPKGELIQYLLASSHLPIFKPEEIGGRSYLDGAFYDNLPFNMLKEKGYKKFILVRTYGFGITYKIDIPEGDYIEISPREDLGSTLDFSSERSLYNIKLGYYDGLRVLDGLKGFSYYINLNKEENYFFSKIASLGPEKVEALRRLFKLAKKEDKRLVFEDIVPKLAKYLDLKEDYTYEDIGLKLVELKAENIGLERFKVYEYDEILSLARSSRLDIYRSEDLGLIEAIKKKIGHGLGKMTGRELGLRIAEIILED